MAKRNDLVFKALHVVAWVIFVGLGIEAGALIVNFIVSLFKPEFLQNLYLKLDLREMYDLNKLVFFGMYGFILFIAIMKAVLFYIVIELLQRLDLMKPFNSYVAGHIKKISYYTFSIGIISIIASQVAGQLPHYGFTTEALNEFWEDGEAYVLMSAVIYVIASIVSRGVEIQNENELTV